MLHYYPRHVSSINMPIFSRTNCIHTASGIFALCKRLHSTLVESGLEKNIKILYYSQCSTCFGRFLRSALQSALNRCIVQPFTEIDDTRCCVNTICPPEDGHVNARNMSRIVM